MFDSSPSVSKDSPRAWYRRGARWATYLSELFSDRPLAQGEEPPLGAHIVSPRRGYLHHGIYIGRGRVVHYAGLSCGLVRGPVQAVSLALFAGGRRVATRCSKRRSYDAAEVVRRACSRLGENRYAVLSNNCEHFCEWCLYGEARSYQIERLLAWLRPPALARDLS
jgi:Lecithin retinol acyltransferase